MSHGCFRPWGWIYRPASWPGFVLVVLAGVFCAQVFVAVDRRSHSGSDTLHGGFRGPTIIGTETYAKPCGLGLPSADGQQPSIFVKPFNDRVYRSECHARPGL